MIVQNRALVLTLALGLAFAMAACGDKDKKPKTGMCKSDKDCKGGHCLKGKCVACLDDSHCTQGQTCSDGQCVAKTSGCQRRSDCAAGQACKNGTCVKAECTKDADCPEPKECQQGLCVGPADMVAKKGSVCTKSCDAGTIPFGYDAHTLLPDARQHLQAKLLPCLKKAPPRCLLRIVGRTDNRGTNEYNLALGDRRARQIRKYLMRLGIDKNRMVVMPIGELEASASSEPGYSKDRQARFEWFESALP